MMFFKKGILVVCLVALATYTVNVSADGVKARIINGQATTITQHPYMVQLKERTFFTQFCGGTLVSTRHVVTAAHCFVDIRPENVVVVGGSTSVLGGGLMRRALSVYKHPEYRPTTQHSDAAVVILDLPMTGPNMIPVPLCQQPLMVGRMVQVSGWGRTVEGIADGSIELRTVALEIRPFTDCYAEFGQSVQKHMFCASGLENKGPCFGDSGGPAIYAGQLCGIVSIGARCGVAGYSAAFGDILSMRPFLDATINAKL